MLWRPQKAVLCMSIGYFIYDTICCMAIDLDWANMLHHTASLLGMAGRHRAGPGACMHALLLPLEHAAVHGRHVCAMPCRVEASWCCACCSWRCPTPSCTRVSC